jgi:hypothetical protein
VTCPEGGISFTSCERVATHTSTTLPNRSAQQLCSPTTAANIRVRRSNRDSTLLHSPAQAGYATRMRQIFEDAGRDQGELQSTSRTLYPQLANISRKASPSPSNSPTKSTNGLPRYRPESLCISANLRSIVASTGGVGVSLAHQSQRSSGSWSDDSGYIVTSNSHTRHSSFTLTPNERIRIWLCELPEGKMEDVEEDGRMESVLERNVDSIDRRHNRDEMPAFTSHHTSPFGSDLHEHDATYTLHGYGPLGYLPGNCNQPCFSAPNQFHIPSPKAYLRTSTQHDENVSDNRGFSGDVQLLEEGGIQLSPLSPNVCIERGPARYHSNRKPHKMSTPCRSGSPIPFRAPRLKENVVLKNEAGTSRKSLCTPYNRRVNTVSWRLD